jgi:transposase/L-amino acid N-acyltransferase YncA
VELFERIRRAYEFEKKSIRAIARQYGVHRRTVRQAIANAIPPDRKTPQRPQPQMDEVKEFIKQILEKDKKEPRKQHHTARRIFVRIGREMPGIKLSERTVRKYVQQQKLTLGLDGREVMIVQSYKYGEEAQIDWYEAVAEIDGQRRTLQFFAMRSMASGAAYHRAYERATQQAFLEAHQMAFHYFDGVFRRLKYDNLTSAVKKILRGHRREETERFIAFRSHWQYEAIFCNPGAGHEKGGVEGEGGYFRRNHLVPVPEAKSLESFNEYLLEACRADLLRHIDQRLRTVGEDLEIERGRLQGLPAEDFELAEESYGRVNDKGCILVRTNSYSTPLRPGTQARVRVLPATIEIWHEGRVVARHPRSYQARQQILELEHYLNVLERKPGAFAGSAALDQWREQGRWTAAYDRFWQELQRKHGAQSGTRLMIELLQLGRRLGYDKLTAAINQASEAGAIDAAAVRYLMERESHTEPSWSRLAVEEVKRSEHYTRPIPQLDTYDRLLKGAFCSGGEQ